MKNKILLICLIIFVSILFSSCSSFREIKSADVESVESPINNKLPMDGSWMIDKYYKGVYSDVAYNDEEKYIGMQIKFNKDSVDFGKKTLENARYRVKLLNPNDYLFQKYKVLQRNLGLGDKDVHIISIISNDLVEHEIIKVNDEYALIFLDQGFYGMKKLTNVMPAIELRDAKTSAESENPDREKDGGEGVLLGIKTVKFDEKNQLPHWEYRTVYIAFKDEKVLSKQVSDSLLVPRKNGFYSLKMQRDHSDYEIKDNPVITPCLNDINNDILPNSEMDYTSNGSSQNVNQKGETKAVSVDNSVKKITRSFDFVGNDYVAIESLDHDQFEKSEIHIYSLDNLQSLRPIKLSDLVGPEGAEIYKDAFRSANNSYPGATGNETDIGVMRRNGYWNLKGRISYLQNNFPMYQDFILRVIAPIDMIKYDILSVDWSTLKSKLPRVTDAYTSPRGDKLITIEDGYICCYNIADGKIMGDSIDKIYIGNDSTIIMAEWALNQYTGYWIKELGRLGAININ